MWRSSSGVRHQPRSAATSTSGAWPAATNATAVRDSGRWTPAENRLTDGPHDRVVTFKPAEFPYLVPLFGFLALKNLRTWCFALSL